MNHLIEFLNLVGNLAVVVYGTLFLGALGLMIFDRKHTQASASQSETLEHRKAA